MYKQIDQREATKSIAQNKCESKQSFGFQNSLPMSLKRKDIIQCQRISQYGAKEIDDNQWAFTIGQKKNGDGHSALIIEGAATHPNGDIEHWAQWADWIPAKIDGREANPEEMKSGTIDGRVREKWEGRRIDRENPTGSAETYKKISAFGEFDSYVNKSTFQITSDSGILSQNEINKDRENPPKYQWYGIDDDKFNCASWVSKIANKAGLSISSEVIFKFKSLFLSGVKWGNKIHRPLALISNARNLESELNEE